MMRLLFIALMVLATPLVAHADDFMEVELDKGKLIQLTAPVRSVFVANPEVADVQMLAADQLMVFGRRTGETTLIVIDEHNRTLINRRVQVSQNLGILRQTLRALVPNAKIDVAAIPGGIVLSGEVKTPAEAEDARRVATRFLTDAGGEVINRLSVTGPTQVMLKVRVVEMLRTVNKNLGFNWEGGGANGGDGSFVFGRGIDIARDATTGALIRTTNGADNLFLNLARGTGLNMTMLIDALEDEGLVTTLAEPSLTAVSGQTASFLAGGEFGYQVLSSTGTPSTEFKPFGVSLAFTPTLVAGKLVSLHVRPEVSQISTTTNAGNSNNGTIIPSLVTRRADTTVELESGQSFAIAGLLQNNTDQNTKKFPLLGDVPVLGALFKSEAFSRDESELVILVTPYIVRPTNEQLATPLDTYDVAGDASRILLNERVNEVKSAPLARLVDQPVPFFVE
jgi:pilus assembly protein CpaC